MEIDGEAGALTSLQLGHLAGPERAEFVPLPYWTWGVWDYGRDGGVVMTDNVFVSGYPDWYRSRASALAFGSDISHDLEALTRRAVEYVPGVRYDTRSDGTRAPFRERYIFTVSSEMLECLPNIPHAPSANRETLAGLCHSTGGQAARLEEQLEDWRRMAAYGVTDVYIRHFDGMWSDVPQGPQEWTLTEHAAPVVGDVAMREYLDELRGLGFTPVLYTNYTDLQPMAAEFAWDKVAMLPNGRISSACWPGSYPIKPIRAVELEAKYAPRIKARFGSEGSFCDVHTAVGPWHKVDFDARLPGAGEFGTTYRSYGKLLRNDSETYGACYSEGSLHWLYAGIADGSDAELRHPQPHRTPWLLDFDLRKIHPLEMDAGMSWIHRYIKPRDEFAALGGMETAQDRYTAATLAFGHQGTFTHLSLRGYRTDIKTYHMLRPLQMLYAMRRAEVVEYRDAEAGGMVSASEALRSGAFRGSQVHVRYETGLDVWANGAFEGDWAVDVDGVTYVLPPTGFVARGPGVLVYSALVEGQRVDYADCGETLFIDARGTLVKLGPFETDGAALLKRSEGGWSVWPLGELTTLRVAVEGAMEATALDEEGEVMEDVEVSVADGWLDVPAEARVFRCEVR